MMWRIMQIKENVIHWGQWRARCITASYIETVKYFEQIIMGFTSCICASIGRRKIKGGHHWHVLVVISIFLFGKLFKKCFWKTAVVRPIGHKLLVSYQGLSHLHCLDQETICLPVALAKGQIGNSRGQNYYIAFLLSNKVFFCYPRKKGNNFTPMLWLLYLSIQKCI